MNIIPRLHAKSAGFIGRLLTTTTAMWLLGVAFTPSLAATTPVESPAVDQAPLIIQKPLPPNIVLMLDDSGSMASDYMPDWGYLQNTSTNDALINSSNNGVYYNPTVVYTPPLKADGTRYPDATGLTSAWINGFSTASPNPTADLTAYGGESGYNGYNISDNISYSANTFQTKVYNYVWSRDSCKADYFDSMTGAFDYSYNRRSDVCTIYYNRVFSGYFQYSTGPAGTPVVHYVAATDCGTQTNCVKASDTSGTAAPNKDAAGNTLKAQNGTDLTAGQNIANWFAYYHTRVLMAKSGVMDAFSTIDPSFRVGFGSIDGGDGDGNDNYKSLPTSRYSYSDTYNDGTNYIANVTAFGDGSVSSDQKNALWSWLGAAKASGGTPLRQALDAVGTYYTKSAAWQTRSSTGGEVELTCRQSYTILTTDGFWNDDAPSGVGEVDGSAQTTITGPKNQPYTYKPAAPYADSENNSTLADVAMKYWAEDLRPTVANEVPTNNEDPAFWQHMVTFTLGMGFDPVNITPTGTSADDIFAWANGGAAIAGFVWPIPAKDSINNIADMLHAAVNGHGGFTSAKTPEEFSEALKKALKRASDRVGTGASLAANSTQLKSGAFAYQANYYTGNWKGDLKATAVDPNTGMLAVTPTWTAASQLATMAPKDRKIYTYNPKVATVAAVELKTPTGLSSDELTALGDDATAQQNMINYLRGDSTLEKKNGGTYRTRETPLGDIVNSQPVYSGQPEANQFIGQSFTGLDTYASYSATTRKGLLLVAVNDGMLHAFNADTGAEVYAYLPAAVITAGKLATLSNPDYGTTAATPHQFFNDGELTVADVYFGSAWHTVAVGTTGRGMAKAVYALDVTDPTDIKLLWERSAGDKGSNADYIGQMTGKPVIAQTNDSATDTSGDGNWSVLIGNGYNSAKGTAALLQFAIKDGSLTVHQTDSTTSNGLAAPGVWIGDLSTGISTIAYAGDAKGRVWSFVLNQVATTKVRGTDVTTYTPQPSSTGVKRFSSGSAQPITGGMLVGRNPFTQDLWVFFGTGQYLSNSDLTDTSTQSWYGLIVETANSQLAADGSSTVTRSNLVQRSIIAETAGSATIAPARAVTQLEGAPVIGKDKAGWYIDLRAPTGPGGALVNEGERIVTPNQFQGNRLLATTRIPQAADPCNPSGRGWIMGVDPFTGTGATSSFFDLNGDGFIDQSADYIMVGGKAVANSGIGFSSLPNNPIFMGGSMLVSLDSGGATSIKTSGTSNTWQRVSWRELIAQ